MGKDDVEQSEVEVTRAFGSRERSTNASRTIPERVAHFYYSLGLFCSSYPFTIIFLAISLVLICCYPLVSAPLPGNRPQQFVTPYENYTSPLLTGENNADNWPRWYKGPQTMFVQQIIVKSSVLPWSKDLLLNDAFRGPLAEAFQLVDTLRNSGISNTTAGLPELCFYVGEVQSKALKGKNTMLPEKNCLVLSPASFWQDNYAKFLDDVDNVGTILNYQSHRKGRSGLAELLLGMNVKETGLKRYPFKARPRIVSYAVTIVFKKLDPRYLTHLQSILHKYYPSIRPEHLAQDGDNSTTKSNVSERKIVHIYYPSQSSLLELIPLVFTYVAMFIYVYFSVKKVEMIKSKLGMAFSALTTVVASLCMSVGLCTFFGVAYEINAKAIYPYLVVIIGLENILVLTRSVVSTASHLDVKIRVAQGLSKEGWSITKNLLAEITILTIGFFTFIPIIQEFCILSIVGLLSDFFLQTFFFATVLSVDIRRSELSTTSKHRHSSSYVPFRTPMHPRLSRVKSNPRLTNGSTSNHKISTGSISVVAPSQSNPMLVKLPKRLRLVYFWARTRFFQRTFTICMVAWISFIIYESGIVANFRYEAEDIVVPNNVLQKNQSSAQISVPLPQKNHDNYAVNRTHQPRPPVVHHTKRNEEDNELESAFQNMKMENELYKPNPHAWIRLSPYHWQVLMGIYNVTLSGKYISILPPLCITIPVDPNFVSSIRHPHEQNQGKKFDWRAFSYISFQPLDSFDQYDGNIPTVTPAGKFGKLGFIYSFSSWEDPYIPSSPVELALTVLLAIPSIIFISYTLVVCYKCICSRNYAEWRSSWMKNSSESSHEFYTQVVFEAVPLVLDGHSQEVECMGSDGNIIASVCLSGVLKIWNTTTGDNIVTVDRKRYFERLTTRNPSEDNLSYLPGSDGDSIAGSSPPTANGLIMSQSPPVTASSIFETRPQQLLNRSGRFSQPNFPGQYSHQGTPDSPTVFSPNQSNPYTPPFAPQRNGSSSSSYSPAGSQFQLQNIGPTTSTPQNNYEFNPIYNHRRTSSFPSQSIMNPTTLHNQSQPIPIPVEGSGLGENTTATTPLGNYSNVNMKSTSYSNLDQLNLNTGIGSGSLHRPDSRVGSPLEKISEADSDSVPPIWCLDCQENVVVVGTGTGRIELWDAFSGQLKCVYDDESRAGVMCIKLIGNRVVAARISGSLDFIEVESSSNGQGPSRESPSLYHRFPGHTGESGESRTSMYSLDADIRCNWLTTLKAHQQPITCLDSEGGRILTGSQDHCLKVFRLEDHLPLYTLHGHYGPITCLFIDKISPMTSGSASQDGMLCVWDLVTGMCMYSIQAHDGPINALTYSASYIISAGGDDKICVWERFQGHLLNTIQLNHTYCSSLVMLTHNLLISSKQGSLIVWDVRSGDAVRAVRLGHRDNTVFVRQIMGCADAILCDYGSQLRLVRFPSIVSKMD